MVSQKALNARVVERARRLREQLDAAPAVEVTGVVSPPGAAAASGPHQKFCTVLFSLNAWRIGDGAVQDKPLLVESQGTRQDLRGLQKALKPNAVVRLSARVVVKTEMGTPRASMEKFIGVHRTDVQLNRQSAALQAPITFDDDALGTFTLNRNVNWFITRARWKRKTVELSLFASEPKEAKRAAKIARALWQKQNDWDEKVRALAVEKLLSLKNDNWLRKGERALSARQFAARMRLQSVVVRPDGPIEFWHNDGGLFRGHSILVAGTLRKGPQKAEIAG